MYIELHCHSAFSFLDGASLPEQLALTAAQLGYPASALTDHNGLYCSQPCSRRKAAPPPGGCLSVAVPSSGRRASSSSSSATWSAAIATLRAHSAISRIAYNLAS